MATERITPLRAFACVLAIPDAGLLPEDVAYDPGDREFLLTSVREARILAVSASGRMSTFARAPERIVRFTLNPARGEFRAFLRRTISR